jgi:hypothetical protein
MLVQADLQEQMFADARARTASHMLPSMQLSHSGQLLVAPAADTEPPADPDTAMGTQ